MKHRDDLRRGVDRRSFLKLSGLLGLGMASATVIPAGAEAVSFNKRMVKVSKTRLAMGSFVSMTLLHPSKDQAEEAMDAAFSEIDRLSGLLSRYDHASAVYDLNTRGRLDGLPPEVAQVMASSLYYHQITGGYFDVTVKPVVDLFQQKLGGEKKVWPTEAEIKDLLKRVDARNIELKDKSVSFKAEGMGITLDGIAVGFIVDRVSELLLSRESRTISSMRAAISGPEAPRKTESPGLWRFRIPGSGKPTRMWSTWGTELSPPQAITRSTMTRKKCFTTS